MRNSCNLSFLVLTLCIATAPCHASNARAIYAANYKAVVDITTLDSASSFLASGSGFVVGDGKLVVTCAHVVEGASSVFVSFAGAKTRASCTVAKIDHAADVAVLALGSTCPNKVQFSASSPSPGMDVCTIGSPLGLGSSLATGIISAVRKLPNGLKYIQTTVPTSSGSSGCPLFGSDGKVIGMISLSLIGKNAQNLNFAIPYATIKGYVESARVATSHGKAKFISAEEIVEAYTKAVHRLAPFLTDSQADTAARAVLGFSYKYEIDPRLLLATILSSSKPPKLSLESVYATASELRTLLTKGKKEVAWDSLTWYDLDDALTRYASKKLHLSGPSNAAFVKKTRVCYKQLCGISTQPRLFLSLETPNPNDSNGHEGQPSGGAAARIGQVGMVTAPFACIYQDKSESSRLFAKVKAETPLAVVQKEGQWYGVMMANGATGWISSDCVKLTGYDLVPKKPIR